MYIEVFYAAYGLYKLYHDLRGFQFLAIIPAGIRVTRNPMDEGKSRVPRRELSLKHGAPCHFCLELVDDVVLRRQGAAQPHLDEPWRPAATRVSALRDLEGRALDLRAKGKS